MAVLGLELWQLLLASIIAWFLLKMFLSRDNINMPPQVPGIPFLGNIFQVNALSITFDLTRLAKEYGDIFTISLFGQKLVAINSEELLLDLYANSGEDFVNRPSGSYLMQKAMYGTKGPIFAPWSADLQHIRRICTHSIMMLGEQRKQIEDLMQEEAEALVDILNRYNGETIDPQDDIQASVINVIAVLIIGKRFPRDDPDSDRLIELVNITTQVITPGLGLELDLFPFLRWLPIQSTKILNRMIEIRDEFIDRHFQQIKETFQEDSLRSLTDDMIKFNKENQDGGFTDDVIKAVILDTIIAGGVTTFSTLSSIMVILVNHQDIQKQLQEEIDAVLGRSQVLGLQHKDDLHYVRAFIFEVTRYITVGSNATKSAYRDSYVRGYFIPKDTMVVFNLFCAHHDPRNWTDPWTFDPARFLDKEGHLVLADHPNRKRLLSFGGGKRSCIGEAFAKNRLFLFLTILLQRFSFLPAEGEPLPIADPRKFVPALVIKPPLYKLRIIRRD